MNLLLNTKSNERTTNNYVKYKFLKEIILDAFGLAMLIVGGCAVIKLIVGLRGIYDGIVR